MENDVSLPIGELPVNVWILVYTILDLCLFCCLVPKCDQ
jgi:hypothetical protein